MWEEVPLREYDATLPADELKEALAIVLEQAKTWTNAAHASASSPIEKNADSASGQITKAFNALRVARNLAHALMMRVKATVDEGEVEV